MLTEVTVKVPERPAIPDMSLELDGLEADDDGEDDDDGDEDEGEDDEDEDDDEDDAPAPEKRPMTVT